jgi:hypothetical protein
LSKSVFVYFIFQPSYWCENSYSKPYFDTIANESDDDNSGICETEPSHLPAGIKIKHLRKVMFKYNDTKTSVLSAEV